MAVPAVIFCAGVLITALVWHSSQQQTYDKAQAVFDVQVSKVAQQLDSDLLATGQLLRGVAALFAASQEVDRSEFQRYVSVLHLDARYPGVQGIGFVQKIAPADLRQHERDMRDLGFHSYALLPSSERDMYSAVIYLEPLDWRNQRAFGFDLHTEAVRRKAMDRARDSGQAALSGKLQLLQETDKDVQAGALLFVPVYRGGDGGATVEQRRASLIGWAFAPLRMKDLVAGLLAREFPDLQGRIGLELYDSESPDPDCLMFRSEEASTKAFSEFLASRALSIGGQPWTLRAYALPGFEKEMNGVRGRGFLVAGALASALLALLAGIFLNSHVQVSAALAQTAEAHRLLSQSQAELQATFETSGAGILLVDTRGVVTRANQRMAEMFGRAREALIGCAYENLVPADERELVRQRLGVLVGSGVPDLNLERRYLRADGSEFWGFLSAHRLLGPQGETLGLVGVILDLSERRNAEQRLQRSEQLYRTLTETMQDVVWTLDVESLRFTYCSPSVERLRGYRAEEIVGADLGQFFNPETAASFPRLVRMRAEGFRNGRVAAEHYYVDELEQPCKSGGVVSTEVVSSFFIDDDSGRVVLRGVSRNISERKRGEQERRIAAVAFESREGMVVTDAAGFVIRINQSFTALTGYAPEEIVGKTLRILRSGRHDHDFYAAMWETILADGYWQGQIWNRRKDGQIYPVWLTITAVKNEAGHITHYVGASFDISRQVQHQSEISNLAFYDPLTGLANRRLFTDRLGHAFAKSGRSGKFGAVLYIDLDRFKEVNDKLGHAEGDRLLELVADRLATNVREGDTVARFGGDEFVVLLEDVDPEREAALEIVLSIAEKLRTALNVPYKLHGTMPADWHCSSSIGVAVFRGQQEEMESLLVRADRAMYAAKEGGRNAVRVDEEP
ncbi:sensor domain-containing diguanylate cyclase [Uliginosibacterium flavum]|uniref:CHASE domain-containing protein n=1 Tax=Uliginosibacterium flavum TaxID=1396831 RepID=A0ABV2TNZ1_9RHOO